MTHLNIYFEVNEHTFEGINSIIFFVSLLKGKNLLP